MRGELAARREVLVAACRDAAGRREASCTLGLRLLEILDGVTCACSSRCESASSMIWRCFLLASSCRGSRPRGPRAPPRSAAWIRPSRDDSVSSWRLLSRYFTDQLRVLRGDELHELIARDRVVDAPGTEDDLPAVPAGPACTSARTRARAASSCCEQHDLAAADLDAQLADAAGRCCLPARRACAGTDCARSMSLSRLWSFFEVLLLLRRRAASIARDVPRSRFGCDPAPAASRRRRRSASARRRPRRTRSARERERCDARGLRHRAS